MPKLSKSVPKYGKHRKSGQARVVINGQHHYLGPYGTKASKAEYDRLIAEWLASGRRAVTQPVQPVVSVMEVLAAYWKYAKGYYLKNGEPTSEQPLIRYVVRDLKALYGHTNAIDFGPLALKAIRQTWMDSGRFSRGTINSHTRRVVRIFRWAASEEMIPASIPQALATVPGLQAGRCDAREADDVKPVELSIVEATIPHLSGTVADMVRLQLLCGMRPQEVCKIRPADIDRSGDVWEYSVPAHKTEHRGRKRVVFVGPAAQAILTPYLLRGETDHCFSPMEVAKKRLAERHANRTTAMSCGNKPGSNRKRSPKRKPGESYDTNGYRRAIYRACDRAFPAPEEMEGEAVKDWRSEHRWAPNQLRHSRATEIRKQFGLEAAQVILGHAAADVTQIYAERDHEKAREVARKIG